MKHPLAGPDDCGATTWMGEYANDAICDQPEGHDGPHIDSWEGWEW